MGKLMVVVARFLLFRAVLLALPSVAALAPMTAKAAFTKFDNLAAYKAALAGLPLKTQDFEGFAPGTNLNNVEFLPGVSVTSNMLKVEVWKDHSLFAFERGSVGDPFYDINFSQPYNAVGFNIVAFDPHTPGPAIIDIFFGDQTSASIDIFPTNATETDPIFFGVIADTPIARIRLTEGPELVGYSGNEEVALDDFAIAPAPPTPSLVTKQVTVGLTILQRNNIPLENLTVNTLLSEDVLAIGDTTASVTVADVNKGQIAFVSNIDGNPFIISYIPASDIQNGTTSIRLGSIADGFIMSNPLMFGFRDLDRLAILSYAKNVPLYQDLKQEINTVLQTDPYKLLKGKIFPKTYEDATLLIIDATKNIGREALAQKVVKEALNITRDAIIGQTDVPYLNDLGQRKIEAVNPTMVFYGFNVAEQPGLARVIAGKESWWNFGSLQFTNPVKESIDLGGDGQFNITFSKTGTDAAGKGAAAANLIKIECILLDAVSWCPVTNKTIKSTVEKSNDQTLASLVQDIWGDPGDPRAFNKVIEEAVNLLTKPGLNLWPKITRIIYGNANAVDKEAAIKFLQKNAKYLKTADVVFNILTAYNAVNVYLPFIWDGVTKPNNVKYCVTEANGVLTANCQPPPPPPVEPPPTVPAAPSDLSLAITSGGTGIGMSWKDNSDNETGFDISYSPDPNTNGVKHKLVSPNQTFLSSDWGLSYNQNGLLLSGQTMCFQVSAYNATGSSAPTPWGCITVP